MAPGSLRRGPVELSKTVISKALKHAFNPYLRQPDESEIGKACREWFGVNRKEFAVSTGPWYPGCSEPAGPTTALFRPLSPPKK